MIELKPCPFCGGIALPIKCYDQQLSQYFVTIACLGCSAKIQERFQIIPFEADLTDETNEIIDKLVDKVIEKWNTRVGE